MLAARSSQLYQTPWRHLESPQAPHSNSKPSWPSAEAHSPQLLQGPSAAEFQKGGRTWHINHKIAAMRRHLQRRTMNCQAWLNILGPGTKDINAEPYKSGRRKSGDDCILNFSWATTSPRGRARRYHRSCCTTYILPERLSTSATQVYNIRVVAWTWDIHIHQAGPTWKADSRLFGQEISDFLRNPYFYYRVQTSHIYILSGSK
jgi:hypothetical protein